MTYVLVFLAGLVVGFVITSFILKPKITGELCFYDAEPGEPPAMIAELNQPVDDICKYDHVTFKVSRR